MTPGPEEDDAPVEKARFEGNYINGLRTGHGRMVYPNGDVYEGEWHENKVKIYVNLYSPQLLLETLHNHDRCMAKVRTPTKKLVTYTVVLGLKI